MTKKCKTVNIPAVQEHNSLKALGVVENMRPLLPFPSLLQPHIEAGFCSGSILLCSDNIIIAQLLVNQQATHNWHHLNILNQKQ